MARKAAKMQDSHDSRARWFGAIAYPQSLPPDWEKILTEKFQLQWARSPLHDKDLDENGNFKKPHYHLVFYFSARQYLSKVKEIMDFLNQPHPQVLKNHVGAIRYFFHLDDPEKAQYDLKDFYARGINVLEIIKTSGDKELADDLCFDKIESIIETFHYTNMRQVLNYFKDNDDFEVVRFLRRKYGWVSKLVDAEYQIKQAQILAAQNN